MSTWFAIAGVGALLGLFWLVDYATDSPLLRRYVNAGTDRFRERQLEALHRASGHGDLWDPDPSGNPADITCASDGAAEGGGDGGDGD